MESGDRSTFEAELPVSGLGIVQRCLSLTPRLPTGVCTGMDRFIPGIVVSDSFSVGPAGARSTLKSCIYKRRNIVKPWISREQDEPPSDGQDIVQGNQTFLYVLRISPSSETTMFVL